MQSVSPNIFVHDMNATIAFYEQLGFERTMSVPETGDPLVWVMMRCGEVNFMFQSFESLGTELPEVKREDGASMLLYIQVKGIRDLHARISGKVKMVKELNKTFYGATEFAIADNNGYVLTFAEDE